MLDFAANHDHHTRSLPLPSPRWSVIILYHSLSFWTSLIFFWYCLFASFARSCLFFFHPKHNSYVSLSIRQYKYIEAWAHARVTHTQVIYVYTKVTTYTHTLHSAPVECWTEPNSTSFYDVSCICVCCFIVVCGLVKWKWYFVRCSIYVTGCEPYFYFIFLLRLLLLLL